MQQASQTHSTNLIILYDKTHTVTQKCNHTHTETHPHTETRHTQLQIILPPFA